MVTNIKLKLQWAPCKSIASPCTFRNENPIVWINCRLTSVLSWGATTLSKIRYPKLGETDTFLIIVLSPRTPIVEQCPEFGEWIQILCTPSKSMKPLS